MRQWTEEQRRQQAERIRAQKPWLKSTGPRSAAGKAVSKMNGRKHGFRSAEYRADMRFLRAQKRFLGEVKLSLRLQRLQKKCAKPTTGLNNRRLKNPYFVITRRGEAPAWHSGNCGLPTFYGSPRPLRGLAMTPERVFQQPVKRLLRR